MKFFIFRKIVQLMVIIIVSVVVDDDFYGYLMCLDYLYRAWKWEFYEIRSIIIMIFPKKRSSNCFLVPRFLWHGFIN